MLAMHVISVLTDRQMGGGRNKKKRRPTNRRFMRKNYN